MKKAIIVLIIALIVVGGLFTFGAFQGRGVSFGSVVAGNEYQATTTPYLAGWTDQSIYVGSGTLGSVVVTKAGDLEFLLVDATTTANTIDGFATSTKTLASFSAGTSAGTYVFDTPFHDGLAIEVISGTLGTSTITFRK